MTSPQLPPTPGRRAEAWARGIAAAAGALALLAPLQVAAFVAASLCGAATLVCARRAVQGRGGVRLAWVLWAGAVIAWTSAAIGLGVAGPEARVTIATTIAVGFLLMSASVLVVTRLRHAQSDRSAALDGLIVGVALSAPVVQILSRDLHAMPVANALALGAGGALLLAALVRFWLSGDGWASAAGTFQVGSLTAVLAALPVLAVGGAQGLHWWVGLAAVAAVLWMAGALDRTSPQTFVAHHPARAPASRSGVVAVVAFAPAAILLHAFTEGHGVPFFSWVVLAVLAVLLLVRIVLVPGGTESRLRSLVLAAAAITVWSAAATAVEINAGAYDADAQRDALTGYQRDLRDELRPTEYALQALPAGRFGAILADNAVRVAGLPADPEDRADLLAVTDRWIRSVAALGPPLAPASGAPAADRRRAAENSAAVATTVRRLNDRYDRGAASAERRARALLAGLAAAVALALLLLLRAYTRIQRRASVADASMQATRAAQQQAELLLDASADVVLVLGDDLRVMRAYGERVAEIFGDGSPEGRSLADHLAPESISLCRLQVGALMASGEERGDAVWKVRDRGGVAHEVDVRMVDARSTPEIGGLVASLKDLTKYGQIAAAARTSQGRDRLTGLSDRVATLRHIERLLGEPGTGPVGLVKLDLDDFRSVNEQLGTAAGDEVLRVAAQRLAVAADGAYLARVGGNVFVCVVPQATSPTALEQFARHLLGGLDAPFQLEGCRPTLVQVSAGVAVRDPGPGDDAESAAELLRDAELAMYRAKLDQGNSLRVFTEDLRAEARPRVALRSELQQALEQEQFRLVYQPIVRVSTQDIVGYEALIRWHHPTLGVVSPVEFIPIAERTGMIIELGDWVLRTATRQLAEWEPFWPDRRYVTVNVASQQLEQADFPARVAGAVEASGLRPSQLVLEVTESSLIADQTAGAERLQALQALGVSIAIDDFGTGYSSLNYLHRFAVDIVKLDKSFIDNLTGDARTRTLVTAIAQLAQGLDLTLVAEGAEEAEQVEALRTIGCPLIQGYFYSRPLPVDEVLGFGLRSDGPSMADAPAG